MENLDLAIAIIVSNFITGIIVTLWCGKRIKELTDPDNWKK